jgi:16S rRNA (cytosine1402-N4)-methyltransferase
MNHIPVLLEEVIEYLDPKPGENFIDATLGDGGHAKEILKKTAPDGKLLGIDRDENSIYAAKENLKEFGSRAIIAQGNFSNIENIIADFPEIGKPKGILLDLGLSSRQLEESGRGFSFLKDEPLVMTLDWPMKSGQKTAAEIVSSYRAEELEKIFKDYGEERLAGPIAMMIVQVRKEKKIARTSELSDIAVSVYKRFYKKEKWIMHPATKIFMALRIAVNEELGDLENFLPKTLGILPAGGRLAVISFHSLEDRIVKDFFRKESRDCVCPPETMECECGHEKTLKIITKKPIIAGFEEIRANPRARSAKMRVAEKI